MISMVVMAAVAMALLFALAWVVAWKVDNYSLVDAVWAVSIGLTAAGWLVTADGDPGKRWVAGILVGFWSIRLGGHLQARIRRAHPEEDARYAKLREVWKGREGRSFFWFFQGQAFSVLVLALPFLMIARDAGGWGVWETLGLIVAVSGIAGEGLADHQMSVFKKRNRDSKAVCSDGLWRFSRHPNYFFESVIWLGFYLLACGSDYGWATIHAPALILFLLLRVTGIPPTEAASLARKGDAYRDYQRQTSAFIPLPPRKPVQP